MYLGDEQQARATRAGGVCPQCCRSSRGASGTPWARPPRTSPWAWPRQGSEVDGHGEAGTSEDGACRWQTRVVESARAFVSCFGFRFHLGVFSPPPLSSPCARLRNLCLSLSHGREQRKNKH